ncbi:MAG: DNA primase [Rhodanobacteraceae bacterium]|nr:MAG: DNA primase [Rhodanobacteraceae bacterium]
MNAELLLSRLQHVRSSGPNSWRADCPNGHQHARGSLAVTVGDDSRILLVCFACHDTPAILAAVGLELGDLYPERIKDASPEGRQRARDAFKRTAWAAALRVLSREACVVNAAAGWLRQRKTLEDADYGRLVLACERIDRAREVLA